MAKIKPLSISQVLARMSIILEGQRADVILPPLMAVVERMSTEAAKDPRLAQYMYRHLKIAENTLEQLAVAGQSSGVLGSSFVEESVIDESVNLVNEMPTFKSPSPDEQIRSEPCSPG